MIALELDSLVDLERPCPACAQPFLHGSVIAPAPSLVRRGLSEIDATRCFLCGDVRLIGRYRETTNKHELRAELDYLAMVLTKVAEDEYLAGAH